MKTFKLFQIIIPILLLSNYPSSAQHVFSVKENKCYLDGQVFQAIGLRCSNALISDESTEALISHLDEYRGYGINALSVYFMGSRYSTVNGFNMDGTINETYRDRMLKIIRACDERGMVVLVGILYWGAQMHDYSNAYYKDWTQKEVNLAMVNTIKWLKENNLRSVFIDPDNEGMAERGAGFNIDEMIRAGKEYDTSFCIAYNGKGYAPPQADLSIHFGKICKDLPYIETEGTPKQYWGEYSKEENLNHYINVGIYTPTKKEYQLKRCRELLDQGHGYFFSSTWLQNVPPNYHLGGDGTPCNPGMRWWFEFIKQHL